MTTPYLVVCAFWTDTEGVDAVIGEAARSHKAEGTKGAVVTFGIEQATACDFRATMRRLQLEEVTEPPTTNHPEPPRDSGEADAVNGLTALGTHQDNTLEGNHTGPGARP